MDETNDSIASRARARRVNQSVHGVLSRDTDKTIRVHLRLIKIKSTEPVKRKNIYTPECVAVVAGRFTALGVCESRSRDQLTGSRKSIGPRKSRRVKVLSDGRHVSLHSVRLIPSALVIN